MEQDAKLVLMLLGVAAALYVATWLIAGSPFERGVSAPVSLGAAPALTVALGQSPR